jgi:streptogramin lyase
MVSSLCRSAYWFGLAVCVACGLHARPASAQITGGFVYALRQAGGGPNEIHGFSVDPATGVLTAVPGSPFLTGGNGALGGLNSEGLAYDPVNARLYAANEASDTISAFAVNRSTGALSLLPFSPIPLPVPANTWSCVEVSPNGSILAVGSVPGGPLYTFLVTATGVTPAPGSPVVTPGFASSCEFSRDGRYLYLGPSQTSILGFLVEPVTGSLTPLNGSPFASGGSAPTAFATDQSGRFFMADHGTGQIRVFTSNGGVLEAVSGNPFASGLGDLSAVRGLLHPAGAYILADRGHNAVGVYAIGGSGSATTISPVSGSPFATGGSLTNTLAVNSNGSLLFVGHLSSRNIQTFRVNTDLTLTHLSLQPANSVGTSGNHTGLVFVPQAPSLQIIEFPLPANSRPRGIAVGPDGNIWFTESAGNNIGRITTSGTITEFPIPSFGSVPEGITAAPDGNLWFAESHTSKIGRITPAGVITEFPLPFAGSQPSYLAVGSDGNLWFTEFTGDRIGRITMAGDITEFPVASGGGPFGITSGPDGNLWFTLANGSRIGRITTSGVVTEFPLATINNLPYDITTGPDGALWFSKPAAASIGRITTSGSITEFGEPSHLSYAGITQGPDGNIWSSNTRVLRMTPGGSVTEHIPPNSAEAGHITTGPDGNMWYTAFVPSSIGVVILPKVTVSVVKSGTGTGTVTGTVGRTEKVNCGSTCGTVIPEESVLTLTAAPAAGSRFVGWSGGGCAGTAPCVLLLTENTTVTATFSPVPNITLTPSTVNFGATHAAGLLQFVTLGQTLRLTQSGGPPAPWTATANQPWITVTPASGTGPETMTVSINRANVAIPSSGALTGLITITTDGAPSPITAAVNLSVTSQAVAPFGSFDAPGTGTTGVTGSIGVTGWALDDIGVSRVRILRDPVVGEVPGVQIFIGDGVFIAGARPDVAAAYPTRPFFDRAGWGLMLLTNSLPNQGNGTFTLYAYADDFEGHATLLGAKTITCTNATATAPFGAIDTPAQGGIASGAAFVNFGWALTPQPKSIDASGSTIQVFVDSASIGSLTSYNHARPDIQSLFPGYANTDGAVGYKIIDTTALANGIHTISWVVTDNQGASAGIGSRYFTVSNSSVSGTVTASLAAVSSTRPGLDQARAIGVRASGHGAPLPLPSSDEAVVVRYGFADLGAESVVAPGPDGVRHVSTRPDERVLVELGRADRAGASYRGFSIVDGKWRPLPIGSTLDSETGRFVWAPPLAFGGTHALVFVREVDGEAEQLRVDVIIELPSIATGARMQIDRPGPDATVGRSFVVVGWALDATGPENSTGIDTLHVWAHPIDGSAPIWIGVATPGGVRPDVASFFGARFLRSGFALEVAGLAPGIYDLAVYAHSMVGNWFSVAQAVRVTVR